MGVVAFSRVAFPDRSLGEAFAAALADRSHLVDGFSREDLRRLLRSDEHARTHRRAPAELHPYLRSARVEIFGVQA